MRDEGVRIYDIPRVFNNFSSYNIVWNIWETDLEINQWFQMWRL